MEGEPEFRPASSFEGAQPGFVFKSGPSGIGYYRDAAQLKKEGRGQALEPEQAQAQAARSSSSGGAAADTAAAAAAAAAASRPQQQQQQQQQQQPASTSSKRGAAGSHRPPAVLAKSNNPFLKHIKGKVPAAAAAGGDAKRAKKGGGDAEKPAYLKELDRYRDMSCGADTKHDRPLVK
ncbi:hypothetical protein Rsub_09701 [Raphidocelis subcapitata]|uniref:Uncharacterized protein n=1 Tax=Raphidocelis subcapitata TaxID=307507 RepID=A0A2V0PIE9_9CHLO|nr:hypothetical protein Rsub_09701 [Raphidocelis subcapitata]|eukprot:GBF96845.1 hypothetical protein Rsub_09701 [Raphidocelis subcapitata]